MQIPPSTSLLHALSRLGDMQANAAPRQVAAPQPSAPSAGTRPVTPPEAARAAAKAAFQNLKSSPVASPAAGAPAAGPSAAPSAPSTAKVLPRGSFINMVV
ncbi:MAG TPA: hypothetical protein VF342_05905 [Alphaproteobacteria bacterium]